MMTLLLLTFFVAKQGQNKMTALVSLSYFSQIDRKSSKTMTKEDNNIATIVFFVGKQRHNKMTTLLASFSSQQNKDKRRQQECHHLFLLKQLELLPPG
jgi:hypothetical protein